MSSNLVFVGTYTNLDLQTGLEASQDNPSPQATPPTGSKGIYVFRHDQETGALLLLHTTTAIVNPSFLALDSAERTLFAVNETKEFEGDASGAVSSFSIDQETGVLTLLNRVASGGANPCHLSVSSNGRFLLVANWESASIAVIPVAEDGRLSPLVDSHVDDATDERTPHAHFITPDRDGRFVLSTDTGTDRVMIYRQDAATGRLTPNDPPWEQTHPGGGPRHLAFHPNGRYMFANGEADLTLSVFRYDTELGNLEHLQQISTVPEGVDGEEHTTAQILVHPSGRFVYMSNRGTNTIAIFHFNEESERADLVGIESTRGATPRNFAIDPPGNFLYAANQDSNTVECFAIDLVTGLLGHVARAVDVPAPTCIVFSNA